jgi:AcrR family transcriptional regulator
MPPKKPRRTAERILEVTLDLFNRFGEPNVSTTLISAELNISPGNLYYHYPAKDELINALFDRYEAALTSCCGRRRRGERGGRLAVLPHAVRADLGYRFLYRDLNDLLSKNRRLETHFQFVLKNKGKAMHAVLDGLARGGVVRIDWREAAAHGHRDGGGGDLLAELRIRARPAPRAGARKRRRRHGTRRLPRAGLLMPHLDEASRMHLQQLAAAYLSS